MVIKRRVTNSDGCKNLAGTWRTAATVVIKRRVTNSDVRKNLAGTWRTAATAVIKRRVAAFGTCKSSDKRARNHPDGT